MESQTNAHSFGSDGMPNDVVYPKTINKIFHPSIMDPFLFIFLYKYRVKR